ncbi:hypothetical protein GCM10027258_62530 [Amycolatopsis stemonae]
MSVWEFDVGVTTHDGLRTKPSGAARDVLWSESGVLVDHYVLVRVEAGSYGEASELAIQMGFVVGYATECLLRI